MTRRERNQPSWDRVGDYELDYTGVVPQPGLLALTIRQALAESEHNPIPNWGARAIARHLANLQGHRQPTALHHFAVMGEGRIGDLMDELSELVMAEDGDGNVRFLADGLADFIHQELHRRGLCHDEDSPEEGGQS
ncbi:hypothetical protein [Nocardioides sp.]|uniref:hypothetical protein n=1 Tax=Nocardioides sp. TaxID=35761 RepID=UPI002C511819|nr:hypothetical protein [Nocardioides sp.]HSX65942.1 hypothetical protein [Nocardioides sp.]